ncbi:hypothetical protein EDM22_18505 [Agromyces tardus]|uniref:Uncharacterized protein n=1 Tax=Agromyces tardus TaxID=2583849 RepID=A0A3M7ZY26_9MICO|nr:hypothetical protein EDM22_18505 [Agromyces tardus]
MIDAATCWRVAAARRRASALVALDCAPDAAGVRADLAACPRADAASEDAARDAALRFDAAFVFDRFDGRGLGAGFDAAGSAEGPVEPVARPVSPADSGAGRLPPSGLEPTASPRTADTPVPVPPGVSSS